MAQYQGKDVELDKPFRLPSGHSKKFGVYVKDGDKVKRVTFGDPNMEIRRDDPEARANFRARHNCDTQKDKTSAAYWSCYLWSSENVGDLVKYEAGQEQRIYESLLQDLQHPGQSAKRLPVTIKRHMDLQDLRIPEDSYREESETRKVWDGLIQILAENEGPVFKSESYALSVLRWAGYNNSEILDGFRKFLHGYGRSTKGLQLGSDRQRKRVFQRELPLDSEKGSSQASKRSKRVYSPMTEKFEIAEEAQVLKVDTSLGLVFGWAMVSKVNGEDYFDSQNDHIPEDALMKALLDFADLRVGKQMHAGDQIGTIPFLFPMTTDVAKSLQIECPISGALIAMKPSDPDVLAKFASGEYTGFSIGGQRLEDEVIDDG